MSGDLRFILAVSCIIPAAAGVILFKNINVRFRPIIYILLLAVLTEIVIRLVTSDSGQNSLSNITINLFILVNLILHLWLFYNVGIIKNKKVGFTYLLFFLLVLFCNAIYFQSIFVLYEIVIIISYVIILQLCIKGIAVQTFREKYTWTKDGLFIFCAINIIYSAYVIFSLSLRFFGVPTTSDINKAIASLQDYVNTACYLLTLWSVLCLPRKGNYTGSFS